LTFDASLAAHHHHVAHRSHLAPALPRARRQVAHKFELPELVACCAAFIEDNLHHGHAAHMLQQAARFDPQLFKRCAASTDAPN
jgi:hypothetical protein